MQAAAAHGVRNGPIDLNFFPTAHPSDLTAHHHKHQNEAIADYVAAHGGSLPTGRLQLVPVPNGISTADSAVHAIETKFTTILPFHLVFERRGNRAVAAQKVRNSLVVTIVFLDRALPPDTRCLTQSQLGSHVLSRPALCSSFQLIERLEEPKVVLCIQSL